MLEANALPTEPPRHPDTVYHLLPLKFSISIVRYGEEIFEEANTALSKYLSSSKFGENFSLNNNHFLELIVPRVSSIFNEQSSTFIFSLQCFR